MFFLRLKLKFNKIRVNRNTMNLTEKQKENLAKSHQAAHRALAEAARKHREKVAKKKPQQSPSTMMTLSKRTAT